MGEGAEVEEVRHREANSDDFNEPACGGEGKDSVEDGRRCIVVDVDIHLGVVGDEGEYKEIHGEAHRDRGDDWGLDNGRHHGIVALAKALTKVSWGCWHFWCGGLWVAGRGVQFLRSIL